MSDKITYKTPGSTLTLPKNPSSLWGAEFAPPSPLGVIGNLGGFAATFRPEWRKLVDPVLVSATDGVGTKLKIAFMMGIHNSVGIDLVAMSVNDIIVTGAEPLFFWTTSPPARLSRKPFKRLFQG